MPEIQFVCPGCKKRFTVQCELREVPELITESGVRKCGECLLTIPAGAIKGRISPAMTVYLKSGDTVISSKIIPIGSLIVGDFDD